MTTTCASEFAAVRLMSRLSAALLITTASRTSPIHCQIDASRVRLTKKRGRGDIFIEQQPSRDNDFTAIVRIKDTRGGADNYEFTLDW